MPFAQRQSNVKRLITLAAMLVKKLVNAHIRMFGICWKKNADIVLQTTFL
jgi:hypothetical protein